MNINREQLHSLIDIVDESEINVLYHLLSKFIPEEAPTADEKKAILEGREARIHGNVIRHEDINWH